MISKNLLRLCLHISFLFSIHCSYAQVWQKLFEKANTLQEAGNYPDAITVSKQALHEAENTFTKNHPKYAASLLQVGNIQLDKGDYAESEVNLVASRDLYKKLQLARDTNYVDVIFNLAILYRIQGKFLDSATSFQEALNLTERIMGKETAYYTSILGGLGNLYLVSGNYKKAEPLLLNVLELKAKILGKQNNEYASTLNSLGTLYTYKEDYSRAEPYLQEALQIREKILGSDHPSVGYMVNNLGFLYMNQGDYEAAIPLYNRVITLNEQKANGSQLHFTALNNVAECYRQIKQFEKADSLYEKTLAMIAQNVGVEHPQYAILLNNIGLVQDEQKHYQEARISYEKAAKIYTKKMGEEQLVTTSIFNNLANTYSHLNELKQADSLYRKNLILIDKLLGHNSLQYALYLTNYARSLEIKAQIDSAVIYLVEAQKIIDRNLKEKFLYQTSRQKEELFIKWSPVTGIIFELAMNYPAQKGIADLAYSGSLFVKNLLLSQHISLFVNTDQTPGNKRSFLIDTLQQVSNQIATQYTLPIEERQNIDSLQARVDRLEKDLAHQSAPFSQIKQSLQVRWEDIGNALKPNEAAVEFNSFSYKDGINKTDTVRYIALVLRFGDKAPQVVPILNNEVHLRKLLASYNEAQGVNGTYARRGSEVDSDQLTRGDSIYQLIWKPIDHLLSGVKKVYFSPSGLLHQVAFAALPYHNKHKRGVRYLADRYNLWQLGSTRQIVGQTDEADRYQNLSSVRLYGGIQYESGTVSQVTDATNYPAVNMLSKPMHSASPWPYLPGSQSEVGQISQLVGSKATVITGTAATETSIKELSGQSSSVLHIATHGFLFPAPIVPSTDSSSTEVDGVMFRRVANPLLRTGLLMAGANPAWQGRRPGLGQDDGILTAYEVANLNLSATKLVVLSACETALGDIRGSEGVFGLQRAFKMAGVGYMLMSLWPVSDQATSGLMTEFYRKWKKHKTIRKAFQQTQLAMRKKYSPAVWASFVLVE